MPLRWQVSTVAVQVGCDEPPSLAFTSSGAPAIACYAAGTSQLNDYEVGASSTWVANPVDARLNNSGDVGCTLAFHHDRPGIAYTVNGATSGGPGELRYAHRHDSSLAFDVTHVGPALWAGSALAFNPAGHPAIVFSGAGRETVRYTVAASNVSVWTVSTVDPDGIGWDVSLAFAPDGRPAVAYTHVDQTWLIKYAVLNGARWTVETVGEGDGSVSLGFDSSGSPIIIYHVLQPMAVMCARRSPSAWQVTKVVDWGYSPSLAFTPTGDPAIAYVDLFYDAAVKYAVCRNGWTHHLVDQPVKQQAAHRGWYYWYSPSLAFNPVTGEPAIAYFQYDTACIKYAVGRVGARGLGEIITDFVTTLARMSTRWTRPRPPRPLPPDRERFQRTASAPSGDQPATGV
jgi:hypothetical protein